MQLFIIGEKLQAQVCTGIPSDPTVFIDFGNTRPLTTPLPQVPAPYQIVNSNCPGQGFYSVRNSTFQCFNNLWQVLVADHTPGDLDGNFLLINALPGPTDFYIDTIHNLCGGHTFRISSWVSNLVNPFSCTGPGSTPNLTFSIYDLTGTLLKSYTSGDIVPMQPAGWFNVQFQMDLPSGSSDVILKISDISPNGCGNDFALDDITFSPCDGNLHVAFASTTSPVIDVCEGDQVNYLLTSSFSNFTNPALQWQVSNDGVYFADIPGATNPTFLRTPTPSTMGTSYYYRLTVHENGSAACKFNSNAVRIELYRSPFAQGTNYVFGCYGSDVLLGAAGGSFYQWTGPNGFSSNEENPTIPSVDFSDAGSYIVKVTTRIGCYSYDTTDLVIYTAPTAFIAATEFTLCEGQSTQLNASSSDPLSRYKWIPADGLSNDTIPNPIATPQKPTTYIVKVYNETVTCYDTASVKIIVWGTPHADAGPDKFTYSQKPVILGGNVSGAGSSYYWTPATWLNNPYSLRPKATPLQTTIYKLIATSDHGCGSDTDEVEVKVIDSLLIPTAFTPNDDRLNDTWEIITFTKYKEAIVEVYDRWGQKVYSSTGADYVPWDGRFGGQPVSPGTYVYYLRLNKKADIIKGLLHVIR